MSSHAASGVLHALFLLLAFMTPATLILDAPPDWMIDEPMARFEARAVVIETGFQTTRALDDFYEAGRGSAPADAVGDGEGPQERARVKSDPPEPERKFEAAPEVAFIEDVGGILAGFADQTIGPDTEIALGEIDEGGGGGAGFGGLGIRGAGPGGSCGTGSDGSRVECNGIGIGSIGTFGGAGGGGASCFGSWETDDDGETVYTLGECPHGIGGGGWGFGSIGFGGKGEVAVRPTVVTAAPVGCTTAEACPWKEIIGKVIRRHKRELQFCYDRSLQRQKRGFSASIDVAFSIAPTGGPAQVEVASTSGVPDFDDCLRSRVGRWVFPETGEQIRANYPFRFNVL